MKETNESNTNQLVNSTLKIMEKEIPAHEVEKVNTIVRSLKQLDGWTPVQQVGLALNKEYTSWGYAKCGEMFKENRDLYDTYLVNLDNKIIPGKPARTLLFVKVKGDSSQAMPTCQQVDRPTTTTTVNPQQDVEKQPVTMREWAYFPQKFPNAIATLAKKAEKENWGEGNRVLANCLNKRFEWLLANNKVCQTNRWAAFNTGLFRTLTHEQLYAVFQSNDYPEAKQKWLFKGFTTESEPLGRVVLSFGHRPERPNMTKGMQPVYCGEKEFIPNYLHILLQNIHRFPERFLAAANIPSEWVKNADALDAEEKSAYYAELESRFEEDDAGRFDTLRGLFLNSVERTKRLAANDCRLVIPSWYPRAQCVSYLFPLMLTPGSMEADLALVVQFDPECDSYEAKTIYPLEWAYTTARVLARPVNSWLKLPAMPRTEATA